MGGGGESGGGEGGGGVREGRGLLKLVGRGGGGEDEGEDMHDGRDELV